MSDIRKAISELNIGVSNETLSFDNLFQPPWKDITAFLDEATQDFEVGQLVHLKSFSLMDAMSAIEIMDPKMDTGMVIEKDKKPFDVEKALEPTQLLWIMDRLLSCEVLIGSLLDFTYSAQIPDDMDIRTLLVADRPSVSSNVEEAMQVVLRAYILAAVKCCQYVWTEMKSGNVFEEEDFTTNLFGLSLNEKYPDVTVLNDIDAAIISVKGLIQQSTVAVDLKPILRRLQLRRCYLLVLIYMSQAQCSHFAKAEEQLEEIIGLLTADGIIQSTIDKGIEVEGAFDPSINRKFTSQAPPRPITLHSDKESYDEFLLIIKRLQSICGAIKFSSVRCLMNFFNSFASARPYADAFSRSKLNTIFYHDSYVFGTRSAPRIVARSIEELVKPPPWWLDPELPIPNQSSQHYDLAQQARQALSEFLERASFGISSQPYYLSSWAYHLKLSMMETILELGFELDLYSAHEHVMIYWYLQYVLDNHRYLLDRIASHAFISQSEQKMKTRAGRDPVADIRTLLWINEAKQSLSAGIYKLLIVLQSLKRLTIRPVLFDDEATRFRHRFKPFAALASPPFPSYELFVKTTTTDAAAFDLHKASKDFSIAKDKLESILNADVADLQTDMCTEAFRKDILGMIKTSIANNVAIMRLSNADKAMSTKFEFRYHSWWPVIETLN
ncbi:hypothetical protein EC973_002105 [Apophysomyces ossiformis]|uniref:Uncharacterized protein n=1 Tax=Apophysomyces ossiformis TaxID=679940 RepID=A0A8H7BL23_9FUNG|nr:hypothetical protein EC973_002105 [Apophysomyces ossiformis]